MRARCERHALALGPSGCLICRREQGAPAAPSDATALADTARSSPPPARLASAPPPRAGLASAAPPHAVELRASTQAQPAALAPLAGDAYRDSAPTVPIVTDAPERPRFSVRIPPLVLILLPLAAFIVYLFVANWPTLPVSEQSQPLANLEASSAAADPPRTEPAAMSDALVEPLESASVTAVRIAQLERTREQALRAVDQLEAARRRVKVVLYSSLRCTRCTEARSHLVAQGIHPTERDIDKDPRARARHRALARKGGLPTIEVDGKVLVGFQAERLDKAIERAATLRMQRKH